MPYKMQERIIQHDREEHLLQVFGDVDKEPSFGDANSHAAVGCHHAFLLVAAAVDRQLAAHQGGHCRGKTLSGGDTGATPVGRNAAADE